MPRSLHVLGLRGPDGWRICRHEGASDPQAFQSFSALQFISLGLRHDQIGRVRGIHEGSDAEDVLDDLFARIVGKFVDAKVAENRIAYGDCKLVGAAHVQRFDSCAKSERACFRGSLGVPV
ncbi:hypothetical protein D3C86_1773170 [compost metagenome]